MTFGYFSSQKSNAPPAGVQIITFYKTRPAEGDSKLFHEHPRRRRNHHKSKGEHHGSRQTRRQRHPHAGAPAGKNLLDAGAFVLREAATAPCYRLWSINDNNPAMLRVSPEDPAAVSVAVEVWQVPAAGLASVLVMEPEGLSVGKVTLFDGEVVLGVIGEPELLHGMKEISSFGGWRNYIASLEQ